MVLGGVLIVFFILKVSPPDTANFEGRVLKFRNSNIIGKISVLELFRQGNLISVSEEEYWFASHVGLEGRFIKKVSVGDSRDIRAQYLGGWSYGASGSAAFLGKVGVSGSYAPVRNTNEAIIILKGNIGVGGGGGAKVEAHFSPTPIPIFKF